MQFLRNGYLRCGRSATDYSTYQTTLLVWRPSLLQTRGRAMPWGQRMPLIVELTLSYLINFEMLMSVLQLAPSGESLDVLK